MEELHGRGADAADFRPNSAEEETVEIKRQPVHPTISALLAAMLGQLDYEAEERLNRVTLGQDRLKKEAAEKRSNMLAAIRMSLLTDPLRTDIVSNHLLPHIRIYELAAVEVRMLEGLANQTPITFEQCLEQYRTEVTKQYDGLRTSKWQPTSALGEIKTFAELRTVVDGRIGPYWDMIQVPLYPGWLTDETIERERNTKGSQASMREVLFGLYNITPSSMKPVVGTGMRHMSPSLGLELTPGAGYQLVYREDQTRFNDLLDWLLRLSKANITWDGLNGLEAYQPSEKMSQMREWIDPTLRILLNRLANEKKGGNIGHVEGIIGRFDAALTQMHSQRPAPSEQPVSSQNKFPYRQTQVE